MYLNNLCFVLVLVSVSASYFDEELPLYLSDDILISKLPSIVKRSVLKNPQTGLTDSAELIKRDTTNNEKTKVENEKIEDNKKTEIENEEESGLVFLPSFGRRSRRSILKIVERDTTAEENSRTATGEKVNEKDNGSDIENEEESGLVFLPSFGRRTRRSIAKNDDKDLLDSESNIVFLPSFKRRGFRRFRRDVAGTNYRQYSKRSIETLDGNDKEKKTESSITEKNEELSDSDTVNGQESGLVFLPSFGRRSRRNVAEDTSSTSEQKSYKESSTSPEDEKHDQVEIRPVISAQKSKRELKTDEKKETEVSDSNQDRNDESVEESGLVFLPSFGRRSRRSVVENSSSVPVGRKTLTTSPKDSKHGQEQIKIQKSSVKSKREVKEENSKQKKTKLSDSYEDENDESVEESGLVFLPSFGRRSRRSVSDSSSPLLIAQKTSTTTPKDENINQEQTKTQSSTIKTKREVNGEKNEHKKTTLNDSVKENANDESVEESGLVFLPSFGRRSRRSAIEGNSALYLSTKNKRDVKSETSDQKQKKHNGADADAYDESEEESGLVFLPSFGRRQRRDISSTISSTKKGEVTTSIPPKREDEQSHKALDSEESGLVFLPTFNRRT